MFLLAPIGFVILSFLLLRITELGQDECSTNKFIKWMNTPRQPFDLYAVFVSILAMLLTRFAILADIPSALKTAFHKRPRTSKGRTK